MAKSNDDKTNVMRLLDKKKIDYKRNIVVIKGGNHANFGNYGHQKGDAKATISRKEQQNQTVKAINNFIEKRLN